MTLIKLRSISFIPLSSIPRTKRLILRLKGQIMKGRDKIFYLQISPQKDFNKSWVFWGIALKSGKKEALSAISYSKGAKESQELLESRQSPEIPLLWRCSSKQVITSKTKKIYEILKSTIISNASILIIKSNICFPNW